MLSNVLTLPQCSEDSTGTLQQQFWVVTISTSFTLYSGSSIHICEGHKRCCTVAAEPQGVEKQ